MIWPGRRIVLGDPPPEGGERPALGYGLAVAAAMVSAAAWIGAKPVLGYLDPLSFSVSQFCLASIYSFLWLVLRRRVGDLTRITPGQWTFLLVIALIFLGAVYTMWIGLSRLPVTAASLLSRLEILVTVFLGMALLGDRFTMKEAGGAALLFMGVIVLRYQAPASFAGGFWMMVLSAVLFGLIETLIKTRIHTIPPDAFAFARNFLVFVLFLIAALWRVQLEGDTWWKGLVDWAGIRRGLPLIAVAALAGPFLARTLYMYCLRHLEVSRAALINQTQPLFVAAYSAILLRDLPSRREWSGGLLILAGALLLVSWRRGMEWGVSLFRSWRGHADSEDPPKPPGLGDADS
jgi:drug/metabolite transporter (DMT)-like permease